MCVTWTRVTPAMRKSSESHWKKPNLLPSMETENSAVVRIFSWYVTCAEQNTNADGKKGKSGVQIRGKHHLYQTKETQHPASPG